MIRVNYQLSSKLCEIRRKYNNCVAFVGPMSKRYRVDNLYYRIIWKVHTTKGVTAFCDCNGNLINHLCHDNQYLLKKIGQNTLHHTQNLAKSKKEIINDAAMDFATRFI